MNPLSGASLLFLLHASLCMPSILSASTHPASTTQEPTLAYNHVLWQSTRAQHIYGLPDMKKNKKGTLTLDADALTFTGQAGNISIPRLSVTAVSAGNERVEIWGMGGRILRMVIPDGGGLAAAAVMHHRMDMLTVEFRDAHEASHSAIFFLPANEAERALQSFTLTPRAPRQNADTACDTASVEPGSVLVDMPNWDHAQVPAAYRALVYEHLIDRLRATKEVGHVYRDGEGDARRSCPQYTIHIAIETFKEGSSVKRAFMGPVGMFVGTTQMKFNVTFSDTSGNVNFSEQIAATVRGESESTNVADNVAKNVAKHYANALKRVPQTDISMTRPEPRR